MKRCPTGLVTEERQIETTRRHPFLLARKIAFQLGEATGVGEYVEKKEPLSAGRTSMDVPQKIKSYHQTPRLPFWVFIQRK